MATSPDPRKLQEVKKLLEDIAKGYDALRQKNPFANFDTSGIQDIDQVIDQLGVALDGVNDRVEDFRDKASESYDAFKSIVSEISNVNKGLNETKKAYSASASLAQKIRDHELGITNLSSKQLKQVKEKLESSRLNLKSATSLLQEEQTRLLNGRTAVDLIGEEADLYKKLQNQIDSNNQNLKSSSEAYSNLNAQIDDSIEKEKQLEKQLGVTGAVLKGISKIPILGDLIDSNEALEEMEDILRKGGTSTEALSAGFKNIGSQLRGQILNPANLIAGSFTLLISALKSTDEQTGNLAKSMNMTYSDALGVRRELGEIAATSGDVALNTKGLQETYMAIGQSLGSNAMASEATLKTFTKLREQAGYTNEQLAELNKLSLVNGKSLEDNTKEILGGAQAYASRKGLVINEKQVLNDVVKASASLKLSLGGSADALAKSAVQARSVGLNLEQASAMADQLLQFESSIENELSAELLTGKDLNFERARTLALNNDIAGAAEEIAKQVGSSADFAKMNAIQQEAIAKAAGLTKDQLAQSLIDREALAKLSGVEGKDAKEKFDNLVKQVGMEEAKKRLGNEQLANQFEQQSVQERFNQSVEKLKEIFVQVAEPLLAIVSPFVDLLTNILPGISLALQTILKPIQWIADLIGLIGKGFQWAGEKIGALIGPLGMVGKIMKGLASIAIIYAAYKTFAAVSGALAATVIGGLAAPFVGAAAAAAVTAAGFGLLNGISTKGNDIMSPGDGSSGYGKRTLFGPEGAIQLNNKDTVIAGTDLFKKSDDMVSGPKGAITVSNSTAPKKETPSNPNSETNALLTQMLKGQKEVNTIPTLRIQ